MSKRIRHHCHNDMWWEVYKLPEGGYYIAVGQGNKCLRLEEAKDKNAAYNKKNKMLTVFNMYCPEG